MELLLWRWSTAAQITSAVMIVGFFLALARSIPRVELRPWTRAWLANLAALTATVAFWFLQPKSAGAFLTLRFAYFASKTAFVVLLFIGATVFARIPLGRRARRRIFFSTLAYAAAAALIVDSIDQIGVVQSATMAVLFFAGAAILIRTRPPGSAGLTAGFAFRCALAIVETAAHASQLVPNRWDSSHGVAFFLASYSSMDTAAEWIIALGCVLTLHRTIQLELIQTNADLRATQKVLQDIVDRDMLTALPNRRALPVALRSAFETGATILFFDLNDFKTINDAYGHHTGDDCLRRFARALQSSFRPQDHVVRYGGDEFVVVAGGARPEQVLSHVERLRERMRFERTEPEIRFSVGHAYLPPGGDPDEALRLADAGMYSVKPQKSLRP